MNINDELGFDFFNVILPASKVEEAIGNIKELVASPDVDNEISDNILKAELYIANLAQRNAPLSTKLLSQISKIIYGKIYSWAGKIKVESRPAMEEMMQKVALDWQYALMDEELRLELFTNVYHCVLKNKPFFDGNEKVARLFTNYLGLKCGTCFFNIAPVKTDDVAYKKFCRELELADDGDNTSIKERLRSIIFISTDSLSYSKLGPSASVKE